MKGAYAIAGIGIVALIVGIGIGWLAKSAPSIKTFKMTMVGDNTPAEDYHFVVDGGKNPTIRVKVGDMVKFDISNIGDIEHEIMIVDNVEHAEHEIEEGKHPHGLFGVALDVEAGEEGIAVFEATRAGTFYYGCFENEPVLHSEAGMWGTLIVES